MILNIESNFVGLVVHLIVLMNNVMTILGIEKMINIQFHNG